MWGFQYDHNHKYVKLAWFKFNNYFIPYLLDQTPLSISRRSRIVAASPDMLNEIVAALKY